MEYLPRFRQPLPKRAMRPMPSPYLLLAFSALFWGGNFVLGRAVHESIPPISLNFWRWVIAALALMPWAAVEAFRHRRSLLRHWRLLLLLATTGVAGFNSFVYLALQSTSAVNAALLAACIPIAIPAIAFLVGGDRLSFHQGVGIAVSAVGVAVLIAKGDASVLANLQLTPGDLWMLVAVGSWAVYSVLVRRCPPGAPGTALLLTLALIGLLILLPFFAWELSVRGPVAPSAVNIASILYVGLFASVAAYWCWNRGVARVGPSRAGLFIHLVPVFSATLAVVLLGETIRAYHLAGAAFVAVGLILATRERPRKG